MLRSYILIALRNFWRNKTLSIIHLTSLSLALSCALLMFIWTRYEMSFDRFHQGAEHINLVYQHMELGDGKPLITDGSPAPLADDMMEMYPEVVAACRIGDWGDAILDVHAGSQTSSFIEKAGVVADSNMFQLFSFPVVHGNPENMLRDTRSLVLTKKLAKKYFGQVNPLGRTITLDKEHVFEVTGVVEVPVNSHLQFDYVVPLEFARQQDRLYYRYGNNNYHTYLELTGTSNFRTFNDKLSQEFDKGNIENITSIFYVEPLTRIRLYGHNYPPRIYIIQALTIIAILIVLVAAVNYISLHTAISFRRAREIGVRKVNGAGKKQIIFQMMGETLVASFFSLCLALMMLYLMLPTINQLFEIQLSLNILNVQVLAGVAGITLLTSILAGLYPAYAMSRFQPVRVLYARSIFNSRKPLMRRILVTGQFAFTIMLAIIIYINSKQGSFMEDLGFNYNNVLYFRMHEESQTQFKALKDRIKQQDGIANVTHATELPLRLFSGTTSYGLTHNEKHELASTDWVDPSYRQVFDLEMVEGRFFSEDHLSDKKEAIVINQHAVNMLELEEPVGTRLYVNNRPYQVIGVVSDFHFVPKVFALRPLILRWHPGTGNYAFIRFDPRKIDREEVISLTRQEHASLVPGYPLEFQFLEDFRFDEEKPMIIAETILYFFMFFGVLISCMGLFGLTLFLNMQRTREIGIRKTYGATAKQILQLLSREYLIILLIANAIAWPLAWTVSNGMLSNFAYSITPSWSSFLWVGLGMTLLAWLSISLQAIRAARQNPADSLKYE